MSKLNVNGVLFENAIKSISDEKYYEIRKRSLKKASLIQTYRVHDLKYAESRAIELSKSSLNNDLNLIERYVYLSNLIFPNDEKFSKLLLFQGYNKEKLIEINKLIKKIKILKKSKKEIDMDIELIDNLNNLSNFGFGINNSNIVINKANEILVRKPNLLIKK